MHLAHQPEITRKVQWGLCRYSDISKSRLSCTCHNFKLAGQCVVVCASFTTPGNIRADDEVSGLLALMLLTDARRPARTAPDGVSLVPLAEQDRSRWDRAMIDEGTALITAALAQGRTGPYQLQAAIAAVHDEAKTMDDTDWPQILGLYDLLEVAAPNPFTTLNRAVAAGLVHGPRAGLDLLETLQADKRVAKHHRLLAARAHLLELAGQPAGAANAYAEAARRCTNTPERRYLAAQAQRLSQL